MSPLGRIAALEQEFEVGAPATSAAIIATNLSNSTAERRDMNR
jgi:hypothetical protein